MASARGGRRRSRDLPLRGGSAARRRIQHSWDPVLRGSNSPRRICCLEKTPARRGGSSVWRIQVSEDPALEGSNLEEDLAPRGGSSTQRRIGCSEDPALGGSSSWRIQFLKDPALEGGSGTQRTQLLEDAILGGPSCQQIQLWERVALGGGCSALLPMLSQPRGWAAGAALSRCSEARAPGWDGAAGRAVPCSSPAVPPDLAAPANAQPRLRVAWPRQRWLYRLCEDEEGEEGDGLALQEHLGASTEPALGIPTELRGAPPCLLPVLPQLLF